MPPACNAASLPGVWMATMADQDGSWVLTMPVHLCRVPCYGVPTLEHCDVSCFAWILVIA